MKKSSVVLIGSCVINILCLLACEEVVEPASSTGNNNNPGGTPATPPTVTVPNTIFISIECHDFSSLGDWVTQQFTVSSSTTFAFRFSSRYKADAAIILESEYANFTENRAFSGFGGFDDQFGFQTVTVSPGTYYLGVRNQSSAENTISIELDFDITLPASDKVTYFDSPFKGIEKLNAGERVARSFSIQSGYRYFIDGNNTGLDVFIISESNASAFINGQGFTYYSDYSGLEACNLPGLSELKLPAGNYYLAFRNNQSAPNNVNYIMEQWKVN